MLANPFTFGNPISDASRFFGRRREVEQLFSRLRNIEFESSSIVGERRIGKTSLLCYVADAEVRRAHGLDLDKYIFVYVDLAMVDRATTPVRLWQHLTRQMERELAETALKSILREVRQSEAIDNFILSDLFDSIDAQDRRVVLLLDEFEHVTANENFGADFFYGLRSLTIHHHLALITSSRRELIELTHSEAIRSSPFFNIFANINLRPFTPIEARELVANSLADTPITFAESDIELLFRLAGLHPYFLQAASHCLFEAYSKNLADDARRDFLQKEFRAQAAPHFADYWHHCDAEGKIILTILALLEQGRKNAERSFASQLHELYTRSRRTLSQLEKRSLVIPKGDGFALLNSAFAEWILNEAGAEQIISSHEPPTLAHALQRALEPESVSTSPASTNQNTSAPPLSSSYPVGLTAREVEILRLVASGMSDSQVATQLFLSPRTVSTHLQSIYGKLGVNSRNAATRLAVEYGLL